jgi:nucleoside-diphosphate-sugar epimerase
VTRALVIGGTGPTGPHIVAGLLARGHEVTIFHRGTHELPELAEVEHIHGDPHFPESIEAALAGRAFDIVLAMYGRIRHLAPALSGRCDRFITVGGVPVYRGYFPQAGEAGLPVPVTEAHPVVREAGDDPALNFSRRLAEAEDLTFGAHPGATILRFPMIYGPNNARPHEWPVIRRVRDRRPRMIVPDGGGQVHTRCAARNAAAFVLAAVDRPEVAAGEVYNCGDPAAWSLRQWIETIVGLLGAELELVAIPGDIAVEAATTLLPLANTTATHCVLSTAKAERQLGYQPVIEPLKALEETLEWYDANSGLDPGASPSMADRFDYATEDALIARYREAVPLIRDAVPQQAAPPVHSMPHPKGPGRVDERGR